jgi:hypothetical protein
MSREQLVYFNNGKVADSELDSYCFRSVYAFQLLHNGYGFKMDDTIRSTNVIDGHKVGWALGAMMYEINTMPWTYSAQQVAAEKAQGLGWHFAAVTGLALVASLVVIFGLRRRLANPKRYEDYETIKEIEEIKVGA